MCVCVRTIYIYQRLVSGDGDARCEEIFKKLEKREDVLEQANRELNKLLTCLKQLAKAIEQLLKQLDVIEKQLEEAGIWHSTFM